jgi:type II secretory pathway pseudopilin PulG
MTPETLAPVPAAQTSEAGYAMAALLVSLAIMGILMSVALPSYRHQMQREREAELVFRGEQYARSIGLFQRKFAGAFPPSIDVLVQQKFLRKKYKDPMTKDGEFQVLYQGGAGLPGQIGVGTTPGVQGQTGDVPDAGGPATGIGAGATRGIGAGTSVGRVPGQVAGGVGGSSTPGATVPGVAAGPRSGVIGVTSKSTERSIRLYKGRNRYNEWQFVYTEVSNRITPNQPGQGPGRGFDRPGQGSGGTSRPGMQPGSRPGSGNRLPFGSRPGGSGTRPGRPQ